MTMLGIFLKLTIITTSELLSMSFISIGWDKSQLSIRFLNLSFTHSLFDWISLSLVNIPQEFVSHSLVMKTSFVTLVAFAADFVFADPQRWVAHQQGADSKVSPDGTCGPQKGFTCLGSYTGDCCSQYGCTKYITTFNTVILHS
jgi:hypothetical protein